MKKFILLTVVVFYLVSIERGAIANTDDGITDAPEADVSRMADAKEIFNDGNLEAVDELKKLAELNAQDNARAGIGGKIMTGISKDIARRAKSVLNGRKASKLSKYASMKSSTQNLIRSYVNQKKNKFGKAMNNIVAKYQQLNKQKQNIKASAKNIVKNYFKNASNNIKKTKSAFKASIGNIRKPALPPVLPRPDSSEEIIVQVQKADANNGTPDIVGAFLDELNAVLFEQPEDQYASGTEDNNDESTEEPLIIRA